MCDTKKRFNWIDISQVVKKHVLSQRLCYNIHQQVLWGKTMVLSCVVNPVILTVHFIPLGSLRHCQFQDFLKEIETEYADILYFTAIPYSLVVKKFYRFFFN